jgi:cobyrinic acid a,c-diamide synthase
VAPFKKGPDYIDPAWLSAAADFEAQSLDSYLMSEGAILSSLERASEADMAVVEGNRGLFDGVDAEGTHSTAELAKHIGAPLILVIDVSKSTRTIAALVLGCRAMDPDLNLAGVILNRVGTKRQERVIREAIAIATSVPVLGAIPRLSLDHLPSRHLGLIMPGERVDRERALDQMGEAVELGVDVDAIACLAKHSFPLPSQVNLRNAIPCAAESVKIGILKDNAFSFYYPENLAALEAQGAQLLPLSPLRDSHLPTLDALYAGGGYPEEHAAELSGNSRFRTALASRISAGLPVWAECGGLMYLATDLVNRGKRYPMVGVLPIAIEQTGHPQAHGYVEARVDSDNPFLACGTKLRGHEFHYSRVVRNSARLLTALSLQTGTGLGDGRDGIVVGNVFASYLHLFAPGAPEWAPAFVRVAREARARRKLTQAPIGDNCGIHNSSRRADRSRRGRLHSRAYEMDRERGGGAGRN